MKRQKVFTIPTMMVAAVITVMALSGSAFAEYQNLWSSAGAGCVPVGQTSNAHLLFNSAGDAGFGAGAVGEIILTCPVVPTIDSANGLVITYRDTDGSGTRATIIATLRRKSIVTGAVINIASINTDTGPVVTGYSTLVTALSPSGGCNLFTFDFTNFVYYVQINIRRSSTAQQPLLGAVVLTSSCLQ
jgi:hypothetical protein